MASTEPVFNMIGKGMAKFKYYVPICIAVKMGHMMLRNAIWPNVHGATYAARLPDITERSSR